MNMSEYFTGKCSKESSSYCAKSSRENSEHAGSFCWCTSKSVSVL